MPIMPRIRTPAEFWGVRVSVLVVPEWNIAAADLGIYTRLCCKSAACVNGLNLAWHPSQPCLTLMEIKLSFVLDQS